MMLVLLVCLLLPLLPILLCYSFLLITLFTSHFALFSYLLIHILSCCAFCLLITPFTPHFVFLFFFCLLISPSTPHFTSLFFAYSFDASSVPSESLMELSCPTGFFHDGSREVGFIF
jgi:hypothetical protein